jgi:hypothetical protein
LRIPIKNIGFDKAVENHIGSLEFGLLNIIKQILRDSFKEIKNPTS